ncbi:hypothetical protein GCM10008955_37840 [Deinococcus malanensis]|uniref:YtxH domain-containing protein n=1 Tax=Deinococcus malanensis TaxID=1706855 RepID=A0ABQ2F4Y9_9DEIO|nr:hypothetical protein [Deinococcus malanensis]GGK40478.1 hypothetical protein GCM10008955_37840 [Deinococcus malanensis]
MQAPLNYKPTRTGTATRSLTLTGGAVIGSLTALLLSRQDNRQCLSQALGRSLRNLRGTLASAVQVTWPLTTLKAWLQAFSTEQPPW